MAGGTDALGGAGDVATGGTGVEFLDSDFATTGNQMDMGSTPGSTPEITTPELVTPQYQFNDGSEPSNVGKYASPTAQGDNGMSSYVDPETGETVTAGDPATGTAGKPIQNETLNKLLKQTAEDEQADKTKKQLEKEAEEAKKAAEKSKKMKEIMNKGIPLVSSAVEMGIAANARGKAEKKAVKDWRKKNKIHAEYNTL